MAQRSFKCFNSRARKPYEMMISEFMHTDPMKFLPEDGSLELTAGWTGDVKYHLGGVRQLLHMVLNNEFH